MDARDRHGAEEMERALGAEAVRSLAQRRLLWDLAPPPTGGGVDADVRLDRTVGAAIGPRGRQRRWRRPGAGRDPDLRAERRGMARPRLAGPGGARRAAVPRAPHAAGPRRGDRRRGRGAPRRRAVVPGGVDVAGERRAVPGGGGRRGLRRRAGRGRVAASADAAVTHAERQATAASAALASIVAGLIRRDPRDLTRRRLPARRAGLRRGAGRATCSSWRWRRCTTAARSRASDAGACGHRQTLALAVWCALSSDDPAGAVAMATALEHGSRTAGAIAGALAGAIHGAAALPAAGGSTWKGPRPIPPSPAALARAGAQQRPTR